MLHSTKRGLAALCGLTLMHFDRHHADPPGVLRNNVNEPKFGAQRMYNRLLIKRLGFTGGPLYHGNFLFFRTLFME